MSFEQEQQLAEQIERYLNGSLSEEAFAALEATLLEDSDSRKLFLSLTHQHSQLQLLDEALIEEQLERAARPRSSILWYSLLALAAIVLLASGSLLFWPRHVAQLVSSEDATWESSLPTIPGSWLEPGFLRLQSGVATIRFASGAEVVLEAPAQLVLESSMKGKLLSGSAIITVPKSAIGFVLESPEGFVVDHGTQFAGSVDEESGKSVFEVLSGEISLHHPASGEELLLTDQQAATVTATGIETLKGTMSEGSLEQPEQTLRLTTQGREATIAKKGPLHEDFLMVKWAKAPSGHDRRAIFSFPLKTIDLKNIQSAQLRLNLVPTGLGFATRLEEICTFAVYGLTDETAESWDAEGLTWENAPQIEQCQLLGTFEVPRSRQRGSYCIESKELLNFLRSDSTGSATFLVIRQTQERETTGLVHAFASSFHPEASGPILELSLKEKP
ncbi:Iron dicitrate transport regulator FecR [Planctomycetales bacterium 10988]|nr:Iron dicitrate transport regulator FecR [Planctomycetales bacterium 10988]